MAFSSPGEIEVIGVLISPGETGETAGITGWGLAAGFSTAAVTAVPGVRFLPPAFVPKPAQ